MPVQRFELPYSDAAVADLRERLARTRWPDDIPGLEWEYGVSLDYMKEICRYWRDEFDWKRQIDHIAAFHHYRYTSRDPAIHFIHERGKGPAPVPLILTHGWPGSFLEMLDIIRRLTDPARYGADPADAFDVIVPSLPGYGFSDRPSEPGIHSERIAATWMALMAELGYDRLAAHGGDSGADITTLMALRHPERMIGIHLNSIPPPEAFSATDEMLSEEEQAFLDDANRWYDESGGYDHLQKTAPQTIAYGLTDSPAGLAAWILDKFRAWGDGDIERRFTTDDLLSNVTLYWMTQTIHSSCRLYYEDRRTPLRFRRGERVTVPCGIARFAKREGPLPPRRWVERRYNVEQWTEIPRGGHFPALEEPDLLVEDIRTFFRRLRQSSLRPQSA
jgi:pimeloyl-ACP methyl ester carboxylesterase